MAKKYIKMNSVVSKDEINFEMFESWISRNTKQKTKIRGNRPLEFYIEEKTPEDLIVELNEFNEMCLTFSTLFSAFRISRTKKRAYNLRKLLSLLTKSHVPAKKYLSFFVENPDSTKIVNTGKLLVIQTLILDNKIDEAKKIAASLRYELNDADIKLIQRLKLDKKRGEGDYIAKFADENKEVIHSNRNRSGIKIPNIDRKIMNPSYIKERNERIKDKKNKARHNGK